MANVLEKFLPVANQPKLHTVDFNHVKDGWVKCDSVKDGAMTIQWLSDRIDSGEVEIIDDQLEKKKLLIIKFKGRQAPKF